MPGVASGVTVTSICTEAKYTHKRGTSTAGLQHTRSMYGMSVSLSASCQQQRMQMARLLTGQGSHHGGTTQDEHSRDDDVGGEAEAQEHLVGGLAPASLDDLHDSVRSGGLALDLNGQHGEQQHLDGGTCEARDRTAQ